MKIAIAGDHYTVELLNKIEDYLRSKDIEYINLGTMDSEQKISLQVIIPAVTNRIKEGQADAGILVCGTGAGVEIGANRFAGIRASLCTLPKQAEYARVYDNANVLCFSSWLTDDPTAIMDAWLAHEYDGDEKRIKMMNDFDEWH